MMRREITKNTKRGVSTMRNIIKVFVSLKLRLVNKFVKLVGNNITRIKASGRSFFLSGEKQSLTSF